jgi:predicted short-subunit dehydrogenase-like oxidoreductase (DUF2520 family)
MRQVPKEDFCYLIIGNGRVARHFQHYFTLLNLPFIAWQRQESLADLQKRIQQSTHILLLITDDQIETFIVEHLQDATQIRIHFSGSMVSEHVHGAHPLMTFSKELYELPQYTSFTFIVDHDAPAFSQLLPGLPNKHERLQKSLKAKYHALCVMSGNFSCILWQKLFSSLECEFNLSAEVAYPYLQQQTKNILQQYQSALTGPLARKDVQTINKNLTALEADPFLGVYKSFVACYEKLNAGESK